MHSPKLTIGMATFADFDGVWFTVQSLLVHHPEVLRDIEIIVVDNTPDDCDWEPFNNHSKTLRTYLQSLSNNKSICNVRWIPFGEFASTTTRNIVFEQSNTPYTMCMDSHVLLFPDVLSKLLQYYEQYPDTCNLLQGPMIYDSVVDQKGTPYGATHMTPFWRAQMYGIWATDSRGMNPDNPPFEIPMHGLGLFTCKTDKWLGFNRLMRGFGGEEGYIHEKYRRYGNRTLCLPFLRWNHRFARPNGAPYALHLTVANKVRNYFLGRLELGLPVDDIIQHFSTGENKGGHCHPDELNAILHNVKLELSGDYVYDPKEYCKGSPTIQARKLKPA